MKKFLLLIVFLLPSISFSAPVSINLHPVRLSDLARVVYGDLLNNSYTMQGEFLMDESLVSINWKNITTKKADDLTRELIKSKGFDISETGKLLSIRRTVSADDDLLLYPVKNRSSKYLADMLAKLVNVQQLGSRGIPSPSGSVTSVPEVAGSASSNFDRSALDQLVYSCKPSECSRLRSLLVQLDTVEPNVMLRAVIYEVATSKSEGSALSLATKLIGNGIALDVSLGSALAGAATLHMNAGGLDAVLSALDTDSRFKTLSRPSLRVKTGSTATFSVGSQVPIIGAITYDKNGTPVQSVEYRPSGTIFTVTPDVRVGSIDLVIHQELSNFVITTSGVNNSPTLLQRTASSTLTIKEKEVIVFAGLEDEKNDQAESHLFGWLLDTKKNSTSSEVLLFIEATRI